jgi:hypothetical protein
MHQNVELSDPKRFHAWEEEEQKLEELRKNDPQEYIEQLLTIDKNLERDLLEQYILDKISDVNINRLRQLAWRINLNLTHTAKTPGEILTEYLQTTRTFHNNLITAYIEQQLQDRGL